MPRIFDTLTPEGTLRPALQETLELCQRANFCVGYFNLRGWKGLDSRIEDWSDPESLCMPPSSLQRLPHEELREVMSLFDGRTQADPQIGAIQAFEDHFNSYYEKVV